MTIPLFTSDGFFFPLVAGIITLLYAAIQAVLQRENPQCLILWGALHDVGILFIAFSANNDVASAGIWLFVTFQAVARSLALVSLSRLTPDSGNALMPDNLRGAGYDNLSGALFALGLLASVGGSPFLVPEGRVLIVQAVLSSATNGGIAALLVMAAATTVFVWLYADAVRRITLTPRSEPAAAGSPPGLTLMLALGLLVAVLGLGREVLMDIVCRGFAVPIEHSHPHAAYWHLYAGALVAGALALIGRTKAAGIVVTVFSVLAFSTAYTSAAPPTARFFLLLVTFIGLLVSIYSLGYIHGEREGWYWFFLPLTFASLAGIVSAEGKEALYGYWELMTFASYFLVVHEGNRTAFSAGLKYYVMCAGGTLFMLPGLFLLQGLLDPSGSVLLTNPVWIQGALVLCLAGVAAKTGLVPLHSWLPDAHPAAPSSVSGPLSGVITKMGIFGIVSVILAGAGHATNYMPGLFGLSWFGTALVFMGAATLVYGETMALLQSDIKRILAYSTLGQLGEVTLVLGIGTWLATTGSLWHVLNHAVMKDLLFLGAGALILRCGSRNLADMRGLGSQMPWTTASIAVGLVSIMGLPPFGAFYSKFLMIQSSVNAGYIWVAALILTGSLAGGIYYTRILKTLIYDERPADLPVVKEAPLAMRIPLVILAALSLLLCLVPQLPMNHIASVASLCFEPTLADVRVLEALSVPWPVYVIVPIFGALIPAWWYADSHKTAGWSSVFILLLTAALVLLFGQGMDTLSFSFALIVPVVGAINMAYATGYMEHSHTQWRFYATFTCMCGALVGMAASRYLLSFFLFWEIMSSWTLYMTIAHEGTLPSMREAFKYFFFNMLGAGFLFVGMCVVGPLTPFTADLLRGLAPDLSRGAAWLGMALLAVGFVMKAAQLPLRIDWQMHPALAPTPVSGYISSVLLKSAVIGLIKLFALVGGSFTIAGIFKGHEQNTITVAVMWIGATTIIYSAIRALQVNGLKLIFIYSTVSQLGYMVLAVGAGGALGYAGSMLHLINHVFFKDLLFLVCGAVMFASHRDSLEQLGGIGRKMPFTLLVCAIGGLSLVGVPPTSGFSSKWLIYHALMQSGQPLLALLSLVGSVLTLAYVAKFLHASFLGQPGSDIEHVHEAPFVMCVAMGILALGCVLTGIFPGLALKPINNILAEYGSIPLDVGLSGVLSGPGAWNATGVFVMFLLAFLVGRWFVQHFTRLREVDVHSCGLPPEQAISRMGPSSIYGGITSYNNAATAIEETRQ